MTKTYIREFGFFFFLRIAVAVSDSWGMSVTGGWICSELPKLTSFFSAPEASLSRRQRQALQEMANSLNLLQVGLDLSLGLHMLRLGRHVDVDSVTELDDRCR